VAKSL